MNKRRFFKIVIYYIFIILGIVSLGMISYGIILYNEIETFYRIMVIIFLLYLLIFLIYLLYTGVIRKRWKRFIIVSILFTLFITINFYGYYYSTYIYKIIDSYSDNTSTYSSTLISYKYKNLSDLNNKKIGIIINESDIAGYVIPHKMIDENKLTNIVEYDTTTDLLYALKDGKVDAAFFNSNYKDMFSSLDGFEDIGDEINEIITKELVIEENEMESSGSMKDAFTVLLLGVDSEKDGVTSGYNADVQILVTFNPRTLKATMTSIPRDMYLKTACSNGAYRRVNTTTWGSSSDCAVKTIENLFDVDINYYAKVNFKGVVNVVDSLGGIDVDVPYSICDQNSSRKWGNKTVFIEKGKQHLNGEQALVLCRNRHSPNDGSSVGKAMAKHCPTYNEGNRNDFTRGKNQMKVLYGIARSAANMDSADDIINVLNSVSNNVQTNVKAKDALSLYNLAKEVFLNSEDSIYVERMQLNGYDVWGYVYEPSSKSYPAVTIPYQGSINDIKKEININLNKINPTMIKNISFDINNPFKEELVGSKKYNESKIKVLPNFTGYTLDNISEYARINNKNVKFIDIETNEEITDTLPYYYNSQKEHKDTILDQISTITIYVKRGEY